MNILKALPNLLNSTNFTDKRRCDFNYNTGDESELMLYANGIGSI